MSSRSALEMIRGKSYERFGGPRLFKGGNTERYSEEEALNPDMNHGYSLGRFGVPNPRSFDSYEADYSERFGPYESYDSGSAQGGPDLYRSGFGDSFGGGYDQFDNDESNWKPSYPRSNLRSGFMDNEGRDGYSSYCRFSSPHMKPASVGSRGRGMPAYPQNKFGGRSHDLGGPTAVRGRGRGPVGYFGTSRPGIVIDYQNQTAMGGLKRKMMPPSRPNMFIKKQKVTKPALINKPVVMNPAEAGFEAEGDPFTKDAGETGTSVSKNDEEEQRKLEARREKQRRRREKNNEKYGDGYRLAYTCSFCKFRTFEEKDIEDHFESASHQETLDYIQKQANFEEDVIRFLHESMVNKFRKTVIRKTRNSHPELTREEELKEAMEGVTEEDYMRKVDIIHCSACHTYVPAVIFSVKQHLTSKEHLKSKVGYKEQLRKESVLTATSILNNPIVKARYEKFAKGEDPFEITEESQLQDDGEQNDAAEDAEDAEDAELNPNDDPAAETMKEENPFESQQLQNEEHKGAELNQPR
ncbi:DBIRD complex subunit ZNF326-like [Polyodon spathula]|uniref:DBIRD complex subunit ZNF326-like n=1 Tax=Polyodon spathula TaxID=7913 RepID=UPI001B7E10E8|nr:DBIRD complex subunit ZNF326-like [Polyodon spathula]